MTNPKPIIGISGNERPHAKFPDILWSYTPSGYVKGVQEAGGLPLVIPVSEPDFAASYVSMVDKLILTGGQNVDPVFYGEEKDTSDDDFYLARDLFEFALVEEAIKQEKPIFSVCRGTQLMNIALGGTLNQDIEHHWQDKPSDYLSQNMLIKADTALEKIYGTSTSINSFHHQSIKRLADDLEVIAYDPADDTIEAVMSTNPAITFLGVQWHPEFLLESREEDRKLFKYVVKEL
ncbi:gamma-glutamyl-gamma-aminobutyrate hydrolase family protein [Streptococcus ratti]|uniref:Gamma-glutamyl-gamma-aminobutyrate hydrolase family protein n=2 Tax=Streptococcus ratti TaxID=1341 RepID=A0A7X9LBV6_STRRT|nr:gamma-glutamyl-gamma-aminobutyrate hydrolase family protein [Streptococcus ratti]VEI60169.1 glutamine amidotransferase [Streptococcus mutans]EJN93860.1 glutamine amidotransferase (class I), putative [Streptococcus ratti FA-1 = DSM 20564]EMP71123.1 glutamine amidotransferase [Streptococcus ratti FA-1 = DSM 20564]NMD48166.1 gamma-glutamyl-gamma-aminobutyrate hydrolase family protein [Streptococcus ratti]QEY07708.1 gamma-glutamyl-gamma-aminobutyrate hydrolase family protein [Streptococcus ratt